MWWKTVEGMLPVLKDFAVRVVIALIIYVVGKRLIKWLRKILKRALERSGADEGVCQFLDSGVKILLYFVLVMAVVNQLGVETTSLVAVLGSAGLAVGLALQGSLSNFAGGVLILLFKPFKVGDYIIEDTHKNEGTVTEIQIFYTKLRTMDNRIVVIPNGTLANSSLYVRISYDADIRKAKEVLNAIIEEEAAKLEGEEVAVFVDSLEDSSVRLGLRFWVPTPDYWNVKWRVTEEIKLKFDENKIEIPYNHLTVSLKEETHS